MANKLAAISVLCIIVVVATMNMQKVEASQDDDSFEARFAECSNICQNECRSQGHGYYLCEMKCDAECGTKEAAAKLGFNLGND